MRPTQREDLLFLLNQAAELEHGLACSYLFAAFSLKATAEEGLPEGAVPTVVNWKRVLRGIAVEEMGHLGVVCSLLTAVGGAAHFTRPNFPQQTSYYLPDYVVDLQPFSETTLDHYIYVERPEDQRMDPVVLPDTGASLETPNENTIGPNPGQFANVAAFYESIKDAVSELVSRLGPDKVFVGKHTAMATGEHLMVGSTPLITDRESALQAIDSIIEEGEGDRGNRTDSHYGRFLAIRKEYRHLASTYPGFAPALPVLQNPFARTLPFSSAAVEIFTAANAAAASDLFDAIYATVLGLLSHYYDGSEEDGSELAGLAGIAIETMTTVLSPLGELLCRMPAYSSGAQRAGPSFGIYRSVRLLPVRGVAELLLAERYRELADYGMELNQADPALTPIALKLRELSGFFGNSS